jgi:alpha-beta hydrolase superfamily lysophospholipase
MRSAAVIASQVSPNPVSEFELRTEDGVALFVRDWHLSISASASASALPPFTPEKPRGILLMHGLSEHCGRYMHVARFFNELGFMVRTYDHRGHGKSGGAEGDVPDNEAILRDAQMVLTDFSRMLSAPPLLFGHSMGGLFAARFATTHLAPISGLILSSPALALRLTPFQQWLHKVAGQYIPGFAIPSGFGTADLSHDAKVIAAYKHDHLVHSKISARLLTAMMSAIDYAQAHAANLTVPLLLLVAEDDHVVDPAGSHVFFEHAPSNLASAQFYTGFYHEIFNELDASRVFNDVQAWLLARGFIPQS